MKHYIEITLIKDEKSLYETWSFLYSQLHFTLVNMHKKNTKSVGVSFPRYNYKNKNATLGNKLRVFAPSSEILSAFIQDLTMRLEKYLPNCQDFYHIKSIKETPEDCLYSVYIRQRDKLSKEKLANRIMKRHNISHQDALLWLGDYNPKPLNLPFILLKSQSSNTIFRCYIDKVYNGITSSNDLQEFDTYGLGGLVPDF